MLAVRLVIVALLVAISVSYGFRLNPSRQYVSSLRMGAEESAWFPNTLTTNTVTLEALEFVFYF